MLVLVQLKVRAPFCRRMGKSSPTDRPLEMKYAKYITHQRRTLFFAGEESAQKSSQQTKNKENIATMLPAVADKTEKLKLSDEWATLKFHALPESRRLNSPTVTTSQASTRKANMQLPRTSTPTNSSSLPTSDPCGEPGPRIHARSRDGKLAASAKEIAAAVPRVTRQATLNGQYWEKSSVPAQAHNSQTGTRTSQRRQPSAKEIVNVDLTSEDGEELTEEKQMELALAMSRSSVNGVPSAYRSSPTPE
jgi:hypothetical protein